MVLVFDIGNSALKGGLFDGPTLTRTFRVELSRPDWPEALQGHLGDLTISRAGAASVVPAATQQVAAAVEAACGVPLQVIRHTMYLPFRLAYKTPHTLGTDRLAAAAAAWTLFGSDEEDRWRPVVSLDAGTAITYEVVDRSGTFLGGAIAPGPHLLRRALKDGTAQLPEMPLEQPATPIGRSTQEALQAGVMHGFVDAVAGMLARVETELGEAPFVVATGGWGLFLARHLTGIHHAEPHLVLHGVRVLMDLNALRTAV